MFPWSLDCVESSEVFRIKVKEAPSQPLMRLSWIPRGAFVGAIADVARYSVQRSSAHPIRTKNLAQRSPASASKSTQADLDEVGFLNAWKRKECPHVINNSAQPRPTLINDRPGSEMVFSGGSAPPSKATRTQNNMHLGIDYSTSSYGSHRSMVVNALQVRQA
ncbi:hypothetical protein BDP67DRAFT_497343 [Colletotrichum lupini]|nr:hypothetical protein BDP67DRAFT_497343 [Colletotrichum lupini]